MSKSPVAGRLAEIWGSYRALPAWVQVWVGLILVPANALAFAMLDTWAGRAAAVAALAVVATNLPIMWIERGMSRLMSLPHLAIWGPLQCLLLLRWAGRVGPESLGPVEQAFVLMLLVVNGISLVFDALDSWRWLHGERSVPGHIEAKA
jgi:hypothetical protein